MRKALAAYNQALQLNPNFTDAWCGKANVLFQLNYYEEALEAYEHALWVDPKHVGAWNGKANVLSELNSYEEALAAYMHVLELKQYYCTTANGNSDNVLFDLYRYHKACKGQADIWVGKGKALFNLKRYSEALIAYEQALLLDPMHVDAWLYKGIVLQDLNQYSEALAA